jgi:hypothetical protein
MEEMAAREYLVDEVLPWDTIDVGVSKAYYKKELEKAKNEQVTADCRKGCTGCGMMAYCKKEAGK